MFRKIMHVLFIVTFGLILSSCGGGSSSGGGGGGGGGGALTVTMTSPSNGATNVSRTTTIQLSTSLSVTTVPSGSVVLQQVGGGVVSSSITAGGTSITISPSSTLNANTQYQVLVNNQLVSTSGVAVTPVTFTFTTGSDSSFTVSIASPGNLASVSPIQSTIVLQAGSPFLSAANVLANVQLETLDGTQITLPTPVLSSNNEIATFTLTDRLASSSTYTLTVIGGPSGIQSSTGTTIIGNEVSIFNTNALAIAFGTLALNADLAVSGDGINWVVDMLAMSVQQIMVSGSNVLMLGNQGAASSPSASLFSSFNMQRFYASTTANVINEYATDGGSVIVGVGGTAGTGNITYSTNNGVSWQEIILGANPLMEVAYGGGRFVALDNAGNAFFSTNGFVWSTSTATGLTAAATAPVLSYANGRFVAVTNAATGLNFSSPDGVTWTAGTATAVGASSIMFGTIAGTNYWVIGEVTGAIAYQSVAANAGPTGAWTQVASLVGANPLRVMVFGNNLFVAGATTGQIVYSSGAGGAPTAFTLVATSPVGATPITGLAFGGSNGTTFVATGNNGNIAVSTTAIATWAAATITMPLAVQGSALGNAATNVKDAVLYVGNNTFVTGGANSVVLASTNGGTTWTYPADPLSIPINAMTATSLQVNGVLTPMQIAVGNSGSIYYSVDNGTTWASATSNTTQNLSAIDCGNGTCVAVGNNGTIVYSTNGSTWTSASSGTLQILQSVAFGNGIFVAVGISGTIVSSTNGSTWSATTVGGNNYNRVIYALNNSIPTFVAVGNNGQISYNITSSSSSIGTFVSVISGANTFNAVGYGTVNGVSAFMAVGNVGQVSRSLDGVNWTSSTVGAQSNNAITSSSNLWMMTAAAVSSVYTSPDGVNFTLATLPVSVPGFINYFDGWQYPFAFITSGSGIFTSNDPSSTSSWNSYLGTQNLGLSSILRL